MFFPGFSRLFAAFALGACVLAASASAQQPERQAPMTNAEFLAAVRQLPQRPGTKEQLVS